MIWNIVIYCVIYLFVINGDANGQIWNAKHKSTMFEYTTLKLIPNVTIITLSVAIGSLQQCSYICSREKSLSLYYATSTKTCFCNNATDGNVEDPLEENITYGVMVDSYESFGFGNFKKFIKFPYQQDCLALYERGFVEDGVYQIQPIGGSITDTWCDMTNGGWTVFQRRQDGSEDFYRGWTDYSNGFGNRTGEYWLGLEHNYLLTQESTEMEIFLDTYGDVSPTSETVHYSDFSITSSADYYRLTCTGYTGTCGDAMLDHSHGKMFTTFDNDNDNYGKNCAVVFNGAWWHETCFAANLNGLYLNGTHTVRAVGVEWAPCWGLFYSVKVSVMKMKRKDP